MRDLAGFRRAVREHRRTAGRTQQQLARAIGLHPDVLSHKLNGHDRAVLTTQDVIGIVRTLAGWGALITRAEAETLLDSMAVPPQALPAAVWAAAPLAGLAGDGLDGGAVPGESWRASGPVAGRAGRPGPGRARLAPVPLPAPATPLIGRERERAEVAAALAAGRLVTLTGVGGTGKTRLAVQVAGEVAGRFADGVAFADLAAVGDPALLATAVAEALGLVPASAAAAEAALAGALVSRELLLVADNLEHLVEEAPLLARLLATAPAVRLLATSRVPLHLYGEHTLRVPPLPLPGQDGAGATARDSPAVRLFLARARAARPDPGGQAPGPGDLEAAGQICAALDGLPLAIELAAARVRLYPPAALLPLLRSRLEVLTGGPRDLPGRQQTLRATLDWSYALLTPDDQRLFACLGVFAGPFDAGAAAALGAGPGPVRTLERLADLADQSLLEVTPGQPPGFRMLATVREYALARLAETGEQDTVRRRHLAHFLAVAAAARDGLDGSGQAALLDRLEAAYPDMRASLEFACRQAPSDHECLAGGLRLAAALGPLWPRRGSLAEGVLQLDRLLAADDALGRPAPPAVRAGAVLEACALACFQGDHPRTAVLARQAAGLYGPLGDHRGLARAHRFLGEAALAVGDAAAAEPHFWRQLAEARQAGDLWGQADACNMLGDTARHRGEYRHAGYLLWQALKLFRQADAPGGINVVLSSLGEVARDAGRPAAARRLYAAALRRATALGNKRYMAYGLEGLAAAAALEHQGRQALVYLGAAQALREETGGPLPSAEQAILNRILAPALAGLPAWARRDARSQGRDQPLDDTLAQALGRPAPPAGSPAGHLRAGTSPVAVSHPRPAD